MMECHLLKLLEKKEYIVEVKEEIIEFNEMMTDELYGIIAIIEHSHSNLEKELTIWSDEA